MKIYVDRISFVVVGAGAVWLPHDNKKKNRPESITF